MGWYQDLPISTRGIPDFIRDYEIPLDDFEPATYKNFNDFFIRKFRSHVRAFVSDPQVFCAGAEARYLALENLKEETRFPVKGIRIRLQELLGSSDHARDFVGGTCVIARLCPVDYHRFHFGAQARALDYQVLHGDFHSVNPTALDVCPDLLFQNERQVTLLDSKTFGKHAMIEVGALGVGKIVQSVGNLTATQALFDKGQEKGYFLFGGSTVIWLFQKDKLRLDSDLLRYSAEGIETWIALGDSLGKSQEQAVDVK